MIEQTIVGGGSLFPPLPPLSKGHVGVSPQGFCYTDFWEVPLVAVWRATSDLHDSLTPSGSQRREPALQGIGCNWCEEGGRPAGLVEAGRECGRVCVLQSVLLAWIPGVATRLITALTFQTADAHTLNWLINKKEIKNLAYCKFM